MIKSILRRIGIIIYWVSWPVIAFHVNGSERTRLILSDGEDILVVKGWIDDGLWGLPGGGIHKNEDPVAGVIREVNEETGILLKPEDLHDLGKQLYDHRGFKYMCHYFSASITPRPMPKPHTEIMEATWLDKKQINAKNSRLDVLSSLALVEHP